MIYHDRVVKVSATDGKYPAGRGARGRFWSGVNKYCATETRPALLSAAEVHSETVGESGRTVIEMTGIAASGEPSRSGHDGRSGRKGNWYLLSPPWGWAPLRSSEASERRVR